jgi:hypothetical protein
MKYVNKYVAGWLETGAAKLTSISVSREFAHYLETLPWSESGTHLDRHNLGLKQINLQGMSEAEQSAALMSTSLGRHSHIVFWYEPNEPGILCECEFGADNFDTAFWGTAGYRYMHGADIIGGALQVSFHHFAEYDLADRLAVVG